VRFDQLDRGADGAANRAGLGEQFVLQAADHPEAWSFLKDHGAKSSIVSHGDPPSD
jgi:hypothetical protein